MWHIAGRTSDPPRALRNLLTRDAMFTEHLAAQTERLGLPVIHVSPSVTEADLTDRVAVHLGL